MRLAQTGELKLLKRVRERFSHSQDDKRIIVGIGDDAAVIAPDNKKIVVTTDMMNEGVHFDLGYTAPYHLGFKLVSVNVSDIMAMGCEPKYLFLDLAFTSEADEAFFDAIYDGIDEALKLYGANLLGGDLCSSKNDVILAATVIGEGDKPLTRKGAVPGDRIYLTSSTGDSGCGLEILKRLDAEGKQRVRESGSPEARKLGSHKSEEKDLKIKTEKGEVQISCKTAWPLIRRHLMPVARDTRDIAPLASAMLDISDGVFIDLNRICDESNTGAIVYLDRLPVSAELAEASGILGMDALHFVSSGGEDYEILFTAADFPVEAYNKAHEIRVTCVGEITDGERAVIDIDGRKRALKAEGYEHFGTAR
jgi:thiamine-monophosphate kinase